MAGLAIVDDRFNLPVQSFILQALNERFPELDIRPGSALYQLVSLPLAYTFQPFRDRLNTLRKNQSLRFFQFMLPREFFRACCQLPAGAHRSEQRQRHSACFLRYSWELHRAFSGTLQYRRRAVVLSCYRGVDHAGQHPAELCQRLVLPGCPGGGAGRRRRLGG